MYSLKGSLFYRLNVACVLFLVDFYLDLQKLTYLIWTDMYTASKYALPLNTAVAWNIFIFLPEYNTVVDGVFVVFAGSNGLINNTLFILYSVHCYCMCNLAAFVAFYRIPEYSHIY